jgi:hypothetical protein
MHFCIGRPATRRVTGWLCQVCVRVCLWAALASRSVGRRRSRSRLIGTRASRRAESSPATSSSAPSANERELAQFAPRPRRHWQRRRRLDNLRASPSSESERSKRPGRDEPTTLSSLFIVHNAQKPSRLAKWTAQIMNVIARPSPGALSMPDYYRHYDDSTGPRSARQRPPPSSRPNGETQKQRGRCGGENFRLARPKLSRTGGAESVGRERDSTRLEPTKWRCDDAGRHLGALGQWKAAAAHNGPAGRNKRPSSSEIGADR